MISYMDFDCDRLKGELDMLEADSLMARYYVHYVHRTPLLLLPVNINTLGIEC